MIHHYKPLANRVKVACGLRWLKPGLDLSTSKPEKVDCWRCRNQRVWAEAIKAYQTERDKLAELGTRGDG